MKTLPLSQAISEGKNIVAIDVSKTVSLRMYVAVPTDKEPKDVMIDTITAFKLGEFKLPEFNESAIKYEMSELINQEYYTQHYNELYDETAIELT